MFVKKYFVVPVFAFAFLFLLTTQISAINFGKLPATSSAVNRSGMNDLLQQKFQQKNEEFREKLASKSAEFAQKRKGIIKEKLTKTLALLDRIIARLDAISEKIQRRINKLKEKGVDVSAMQVAFDSCANSRGAFSTAISGAKSKVALVTDNGQADGSAMAALAAARTAFESGKAHHKCIVGVIIILRASAPKEATGSGN